MQMGILSVADDAAEPEYKRWLARWYLRLGYEHRETLLLRVADAALRDRPAGAARQMLVVRVVFARGD